MLVVTRKNIQDLKASKVLLRIDHPRSWPLSLKLLPLRFLHLHLQLHFPSWTDWFFILFLAYIFIILKLLKITFKHAHFCAGSAGILNRENLCYIKESWPAQYDGKSKCCCWLKPRTFFIYSGRATLQNRSHSELWDLYGNAMLSFDYKKNIKKWFDQHFA